ncbi:MAG: hypothetical protein GY854_13720 [Deltaproteobacteria bacterium]|nr:hypothetical protein [Deltaproteobacteria bacterium]
MSEQTTTNARALHRRRVPFLIGLVLVVIGVVGIGHFIISAALAGFPDSVLASGRNWIFIALHGLISAAGLVLTGYSYK